MVPNSRTAAVTFLFTDIEGSTQLWEQEPERMRPALARHDTLARAAVESHRGTVVKMTGDGIHAAFGDPLDAVGASLQIQQAMAELEATDGIALRLRCGLHVGVEERRDNDFFGSAVNRAARIMSVAHGGQVLLSQAVALLIGDRLPAEVSLRDLGFVRLRDLASPEHVYQVLHPRLRQVFPVLRSLEATPNNLPHLVTRFIGRDRALAELRRLLSENRLLTLTGAGGCGKTRLGLQLAANALEDFPDGAWLVELAALADPRLLSGTVAMLLGLKEQPGEAIVQALIKHLKDKRLLLLLDNCEHLLDGCAQLAETLIRQCPQLKILATSREALGVQGEQAYRVPSLSLPDPRQAQTLASVAPFEAVQLFSDRALLARADFEVNDHNAAKLASICHRLDGIPLAIELAAARVRSLSVEEIDGKLDQRFRLLTGGSRTALPRQRTLRSLIDWSYDLLNEAEKALLCRASVFSSGWTLEAAERVCGEELAGEEGVLDLLASLVGKSLVIADERDGATRYRMLETVRQYAQDRLHESGEQAAIRSRHLAFYLKFAEQARPQLIGPAPGIWLARLDLERENLLSAHSWCDGARGGAESGLKLASALRRYWIIRGLLELGHRVTVEALARPGAQERSVARCAALFDAGQLCGWMGRYIESQEYLEQCLAIARESGDRRMVALVLQPLGLAAHGVGNPSKARGHFEEALALARDVGNPREIAAALNALAQLHRAQGELDTAEPLYQNALLLARELEDRESIAIALLNLAMVSIARGFGDPARAMLLEVSAIVDEIGSKPLAQSVLEVCAGLGAFREQWAQAARLYGAVEAQARRTGLRRDPTDDAFLGPLIARARQALGTAAFASTEAEGRALVLEDAAQEARAWLETGP